MPSKSRVAKQQNRFALTCSFGELKGLYPVHFSQLRTDPLADIDETDLLRDLQVGLERVARSQGVDVSIIVSGRGSWETCRWLPANNDMPTTGRSKTSDDPSRRIDVGIRNSDGPAREFRCIAAGRGRAVHPGRVATTCHALSAELRDRHHVGHRDHRPDSRGAGAYLHL